MPASAIVTPSELMITYFHAASSELALPSSPTSAALARVLASMRTNSRPRLPVSSEASISDANRPKKMKYSRTWNLAQPPGRLLGRQVADRPGRRQQRDRGDREDEEAAQ